jgi:hypothetical protein
MSFASNGLLGPQQSTLNPEPSIAGAGFASNGLLGGVSFGPATLLSNLPAAENYDTLERPRGILSLFLAMICAK